MYTLRTFKNTSIMERTQLSLGDNYSIKYVSEEDEKLNIKLRVFGSNIEDEGIAIYNDDYAFIMTDSGKTFETLNNPKN